MNGLHVAVEGLDGSGKSTLIAGLLDHFAGRREAREFRLPDGDAFAGRDLLDVLGHAAAPPSANVLALGFAANRLAAYERHVGPWLAGHPERIALSHRYVLSGLAYQSVDGVPLPWLVTLNELVPAPDLTVFIDTDPAVCQARVGLRERTELFERRFETMRRAFLDAIALLTEQGWRIEFLDGSLPPPKLVDAALTLITP